MALIAGPRHDQEGIFDLPDLAFNLKRELLNLKSRPDGILSFEECGDWE
jgi:hypothetical protein